MRTHVLALFLAAVPLTAGLGACHHDQPAAPDAAPPDAAPDAVPDAMPAPAFRHPLSTSDAELATEALQILGANVVGHRDSCGGSCHPMTRQTFRYWRALSDQSMTSCLTDLEVASDASAKTMMDCLRTDPASASSQFATAKLGIFSVAANLDWFAYTMNRAYGTTEGPTQLAALIAHSGEPRGTITKLTQGDFDIVAEWFARGVPQLDDALPEDPPPSICTPGVSADVSAHVTAMKTQGWRAADKDAGLLMYGCATAADTLGCLADKPDSDTKSYATGWKAGPAGQVLRVLKELTYHSSYWTRSSADGRFVGQGAQIAANSQTYSAMIDLQRDAIINVNAYYDPGFFPDNSGFIFQGPGKNLCPMSVLTTGAPTTISMSEPGCTDGNVGLYEHVGATLGGGDYFSVDGQFISDDGGHTPTLTDPRANFARDGATTFTPLVNNGSTGYQSKPGIDVIMPYEGDTIIAPSARLALTRVAGPGGHQLGFVLHKVNATPVGSSYTIQAPEIARYCQSGGKPAFSYDERWLIYHHYVQDADAVDLGFTGPTDPNFAAYRTRGASNIYLLELTSGKTTRLTNMHAGQYALYPHFRADGWIYFLVRDPEPVPANDREYVVASDAALRME